MFYRYRTINIQTLFRIFRTLWRFIQRGKIKFKNILDTHLPKFVEPPKAVDLKLPKLKKIGQAAAPKIKLPKLKKV